MKNIFLLLHLAIFTVCLSQKNFAQTAASALPGIVTADANLTAGNKVIISWTITAKIITDYFTVEKSNDGISWRSILTEKALNDTVVPFTYNATDAFPLKGLNFYRVRLKDKDGNFMFTTIKCVRANGTGQTNIYPNPSSNYVQITLSQLPQANWSILLINNSGQVMTQKNYSKTQTVITLPVNNFPEGNYILQIKDGAIVQSSKLVIMHN